MTRVRELVHAATLIGPARGRTACSEAAAERLSRGERGESAHTDGSANQRRVSRLAGVMRSCSPCTCRGCCRYGVEGKGLSLPEFRVGCESRERSLAGSTSPLSAVRMPASAVTLARLLSAAVPVCRCRTGCTASLLHHPLLVTIKLGALQQLETRTFVTVLHSAQENKSSYISLHAWLQAPPDGAGLCCQAVPQSSASSWRVRAARSSPMPHLASLGPPPPLRSALQRDHTTLASPASKTCHRLLLATFSRFDSRLVLVRSSRRPLRKKASKYSLSKVRTTSFDNAPCTTSFSSLDWPLPVWPPPTAKARRPFTHEPPPNLPALNGDKRPHSPRELRIPRPLRPPAVVRLRRAHQQRQRR